jgi:hypothetical protein
VIPVFPQELMKSSVFHSWTKKAQWVGLVGLKGLIWRRGVGIVKFGGRRILAFWFGSLRIPEMDLE